VGVRYIRETLMGLAQINIAQAKSSPSANLALIGQEANRPRGLIGRLIAINRTIRFLIALIESKALIECYRPIRTINRD